MMVVPPTLQIGEGFAGEGPHAAHVNTVVGARTGPAGIAWATALATPSAGHVAFMVVAAPGVAVQPPTLFVAKATVEPGTHARLTWGAAQAGVAAGVVQSVAHGVLDAAAAGDVVALCAVWVDPAATDADAVYANNRAATEAALASGRVGGPATADVAAAVLAAGRPWNPYYPLA